MDQKQKLLGYYNYTVILTYIGMLTGFIGIIYADTIILKDEFCVFIVDFGYLFGNFLVRFGFIWERMFYCIHC